MALASPPQRMLRLHQAVVVAVSLCCIAAGLFSWVVKVHDVVPTTGHVAADHSVAQVHAKVTGLVTRVHASVGDHLEKNAPILALDPNLSPDKLADTERRLAMQHEEAQRLRKGVEVVSQIVSSPDRISGNSLSSLGVTGETFNLINDVYTARLELDNAAEYRRSNVAHQKNQIVSEITLVQRNIELLKRNLEVSKRDSSSREAALEAKRNDFAGLMKLADKGLVSATDVNRERDGMLQAELSVTENHKQVDQIELDISNRNLHISELKMQSESVEEDATNRYNAARLKYDLRLARLNEHKSMLERQLQGIEQNASALDVALKIGEGDRGIIVLTAPVAGILTRLRFHTPGDGVEVGNLVATLQPDGTRPVVLAHLANRDVGRVREGQLARVKVDAYPFEQFGTVGAVVTRVFAEPDSPDFTIKLLLATSQIQVEELPAPILPGLRVHVDVFTEERRLFDLLVRHP